MLSETELDETIPAPSSRRKEDGYCNMGDRDSGKSTDLEAGLVEQSDFGYVLPVPLRKDQVPELCKPPLYLPPPPPGLVRRPVPLPQLPQGRPKRKWSRPTICMLSLLVIIIAVGVAVGLTYYFTSTLPCNPPQPSKPISIEKELAWPKEGKWKKFEESCYFFATHMNRTWMEATKECWDRGASLVSIHSKNENDWIYETLLDSGANNFAWIGLIHCRRGAGPFDCNPSTHHNHSWIDFTTLDYENWDDEEPSDSRGSYESCVEIYTSYHDRKWNDVPCFFKLHFVCKASCV